MNEAKTKIDRVLELITEEMKKDWNIKAIEWLQDNWLEKVEQIQAKNDACDLVEDEQEIPSTVEEFLDLDSTDCEWTYESLFHFLFERYFYSLDIKSEGMTEDEIREAMTEIVHNYSWDDDIFPLPYSEATEWIQKQLAETEIKDFGNFGMVYQGDLLTFSCYIHDNGLDLEVDVVDVEDKVVSFSLTDDETDDLIAFLQKAKELKSLWQQRDEEEREEMEELGIDLN